MKYLNIESLKEMIKTAEVSLEKYKNNYVFFNMENKHIMISNSLKSNFYNKSFINVSSLFYQNTFEEFNVDRKDKRNYKVILDELEEIYKNK